jgi:hypothetical protein
MKSTVKTPKLDKTLKRLKGSTDKALMYTGGILRGKIVKQWLKGNDPNGKAFKKGNKKYLKWKKGEGRKGKIDFNLSGDMQEAFTWKKYAKNTVLLFFNSSIERDKAKGNYKKRKTMLKVGKKLREEITRIFYKRLMR